MLKTIERATGKTIERMDLPSTTEINEQRVQRFKQNIQNTINDEDLGYFKTLVTEMVNDSGVDAVDVAAALAHLSNGAEPFLLNERREREQTRNERGSRDRDGKERNRHDRDGRRDKKSRDKPGKRQFEFDSDTYKIKVGRDDGVTPGNIVGAIANEADISSKHIGHIKLFDSYSTVDLPKGMPKETFDTLYKTWVCNKQLQLSLVTEGLEPRRIINKPKKRKQAPSKS